jgi:hypothetical protein
MPFGGFQPPVISQMPQQPQQLQSPLNIAQITELDYQMEQGGEQNT